MTTTGFELVLPFLRPIQHLILDPEISEIMVNGSECVLSNVVEGDFDREKIYGEQ
jgi:Flp pilus assembly CpaF family ATPase